MMAFLMSRKSDSKLSQQQQQQQQQEAKRRPNSMDPRQLQRVQVREGDGHAGVWAAAGFVGDCAWGCSA